MSSEQSKNNFYQGESTTKKSNETNLISLCKNNNKNTNDDSYDEDDDEDDSELQPSTRTKFITSRRPKRHQDNNNKNNEQNALIPLVGGNSNNHYSNSLHTLDGSTVAPYQPASAPQRAGDVPVERLTFAENQSNNNTVYASIDNSNNSSPERHQQARDRGNNPLFEIQQANTDDQRTSNQEHPNGVVNASDHLESSSLFFASIRQEKKTDKQ
jgi:hypothetical protein